MAAPISKGPKIALNFDRKHSDPNEQAVSKKLCTLDPQKKIVYFAEGRCLEDESLNQYSLELLSHDNPTSTATSCQLLVALMLTKRMPCFLKLILTTIYTDPSLKKLFTEKHYSKYDPNQYGLDETRKWKPLYEGNMTDREKTAIKNVEGLFRLLDQELPKMSSFRQRVSFFESHMTAAANVMTVPNGAFGYKIFEPISEALAFIKIKEVHLKLDSKELSLSMINQLYGGTESFTKLLADLNRNFRTQFQANKVIKIVEKILNAGNSDPSTIFVVRVGDFHRDVLTSELKQHFTNGDIREISLAMEDLPKVEEKIQDLFSSTESGPVQPAQESESLDSSCILL